MLSKEDRTSLTWLQMNYETHFKITLEDDGTWRALPLSGQPEVLTSDTACGLRDAIRDQLGLEAQATRSTPPDGT
jgi:hypothetical protein